MSIDGSGPGVMLTDRDTVAQLQDQAQMTLCRHIQQQQQHHKKHRHSVVAAAGGLEPSRFGRLLLMLPCLREVSALGLVDIFFRRTIGDSAAADFDRVLTDIYTSRDL